MNIKQLNQNLRILVVLGLLFLIKPVQAQVYPDIARASFPDGIVNGVKIKTNIPFIKSADMLSLEIKGFSYGISSTLSLHLCFYLFEDEGGVYVHGPNISSSGAHTPKVLLANEAGKVVIFIDDKVYHQKLYLNAYSGLNRPTYYTGWTIVDEPLTGTKVVESTYKNSFKGEITLPGGKWTSGGNVGIGTDAPQEKLSVNGKIRAHEIKVESTASTWPDYVFEEEYDLPSLKNTAEFIKTNKHLPGVPTASDVEKDGVSLGEMNKILLQKVEELTLHLIQKDKQMENHEEEINKLKQMMQRMQTKISK